MTLGRRIRLLRRGLPLGLVALLVLPASASAHAVTGRYESPLPLAAYLGGAALAVALSFAIVILRSSPAAAATRGGSAHSTTGRLVRVPGSLRFALRALGLVALLWVVAQGIAGGTASDADASSLFLWTYGWVGLPILSALIAPAWEWLDPFGTLNDAGRIVVRRLRLPTWQTVPYPESLGHWPAVGALVVFVWLELVYTSARGGRVLALAVVVYAAWTLLMMAQFGRTAWRRHGEVFTVCFGILNRLASVAPNDESTAVLRTRRFGAGLLEATWTRSELALVAVATGGILFDGLSQTQAWFDLFGVPPLVAATVQLLVFLAFITALVMLVGRAVGTRAMAAGLVPIAFGYLVAHYFTALVFDGQRIVTVTSDPFNAGWDLLGNASFEPNETWLPFGIIWAIQLVAVVGGHICGAVTGHRAAISEGEPVADRVAASGTAGAKSTGVGGGGAAAKGTGVGRRGPWADVRVRQVPLAVLMVFLTTLTLWSLGQNLVHTVGEARVTTQDAARG